MTTNNQKLSGFKKHVQLEKLVMQDILEHKDMRSTYEYSNSPWKSKGISQPIFHENVGAVSIFSIGELQNNFYNAELIYGDDRRKQAEGLLRDAAKYGNRRDLAGGPTFDSIEELREYFPNFGEAIDHIMYATALSSLSGQNWFQMSPVLLLGPAGIGKTAFAQSFAKMLEVDFKRLDVGIMSTSAVLAGLSMGWASGHTGEICKLMCQSKYANPILLLDEVDKVSGHDNAPIEPTLLALLEAESSANFRDEALQLHFNCKHILFLASANDVSQMSRPLLSRFTVVNVRAPSKDEAPKVIANIYRTLRSDNPWGRKFAESLPENVIDQLSSFKPRLVSSLLKSAFGRAAIRGGNQISIVDLPISDTTKKQARIGFL